MMTLFRLLALVVLLLAAQCAAAQEKPAPLFHPFDHEIGDFNLQERVGARVTRRDLLGKIWVVQFFYPRCNLCSKNTPTMQRIQEVYRGNSDVRLVSIALNNDLPQTLQDFAASHGAEPNQWLFLTGPMKEVHEVVRVSFFSPVSKNENSTPGDEIIHSTSLMLIDPQGKMVGFVDGTVPGAADALQREIDRLRVRRRLDERIPITGADMPRINAVLNSACTLLLLLGWCAIRFRLVTLHKILMLLALATSMIFLSSYLFYHFVVLEAEPMRFAGTGAVRWVYYTILLTHTVLAIVVAPLAIYITVQGLRNALPQHVKVARWTLPIWLYVSITGVVVYWMLYRVEW
jgi:protein SCO1/2/putative membrane protein